MPVTPCLEPGCSAFATRRGRCDHHHRVRDRETHTPTTHHHRRAGAGVSGIYRTKRWLVLRLAYLTQHPLCEQCTDALAT